MWDYTDSVIDHFVNPRNVGEIADANGVGQVGSLACGDALKLFLKIDPASEVIMDAKFKTFGCASAIASASALTEIIKGRTITQAQTITNDDIAKFLGGLPEQKMHCSVMGREALDAAIANYHGETTTHVEHEEKIICKCFWVSEKKIRENIIAHKLTTVEQVTNYTKAGGGCGGCIPDIKRILAEVGSQAKAGQGQQPRKMTAVQRVALIQKVLSEDIAPALAHDGGSVELVDVDGPNVVVRLMGACSHCVGADFTLQNLVETKLREKVDQGITVREEA